MLFALDTSTQTIGMALFDGAQILGETIWKTQNHHTIEVAPALRELLERCGLKPADIEAIGVALGPGSFTSLRIGLAVAKGIALAQRIPLIGVPTMDFLAASQPKSENPLAVVLQAGRGRVAVGWYKWGRHSWESQGEPTVQTIQMLTDFIESPTLVCGEMTAPERQMLARKRKNVLLASPAASVRRPSFLAEIAWRRWKTGKLDDVISLAPIYLHTGEAIPG
jgi:tRNA threonylcarbamoyladenosine biosynthesis protein TsaB